MKNAKQTSWKVTKTKNLLKSLTSTRPIGHEVSSWCSLPKDMSDNELMIEGQMIIPELGQGNKQIPTTRNYEK